jgi:cell wall-associated NlpC family hydrolase
VAPASLSQQIAGYLSRKGSPLSAYANDFVQVGSKYGIDPRFLVAISGAETSFGKAGSKLANPFGYMSAKHFSGPREVLERLATDLTRQGANGLYKGKNTIGAIGATWAPPGASNDAGGNSGWPALVSNFYKELGGNPNAPVKGGRGAQQPGALGAGATTQLAPMPMLSPQMLSAIQGYSSRASTSLRNGTFDPYSKEYTSLRDTLLSRVKSFGSGAQQGATVATAGGAGGGTFAGASPKASAAIQAGIARQGTPYSWGGGTPAGPTRGFNQGANTVGFDCSSFVQYAWAKAGINIPRVTGAQIDGLPKVKDLAHARPGDLLFPHRGHVQMYLGNGKVIEAPRTGGHVRITGLRSSYMAIRRPGG